MNGSLRIGHLFGIPIYLHWTFLLVIPLFAWIIGSQIVLTTQLLASLFGLEITMTLYLQGWMPYILGTLVVLGLFAGVLVHELAHSLVAKSKGIRIHSITLLIFGGVASMEEEMPDPKVELPMALVGPLTSGAIGGIFLAITYGIAAAATAGAVDEGVAGVLVFFFGYLALLNIILFLFNLLPAFPMDGGRVLRAWLAKKMPLHQATKIAADVGRGFAVFFGIFGFLILSPILVIIAFFIYIGANQEATAVRYNFLLKDVVVKDVMSAPVTTVRPDQPVMEVVAMMYETKHLGFPVVEHGEVIGMVTLGDVHAAPPIDREAMQVRDLMSKEVMMLKPSSPLTEAMKIMSRSGIGRIPVMEAGELVGIVTRTDVLTTLEIKEA
ncbi:Zn-dependent protease [Methanofollis sp. W23]|uniref:CBS domain-containing protein n=1 Tax=Methanofollis sp. W23 TaxID=2817849 RepID=UPI001AE8C6ED|nr:CBS domain-containing protein [Methanofollis sp. W23]MBP2146239.1 Zn-dependent protease [Methanofollis sp. W23]